jgi:hypothetical protein
MTGGWLGRADRAADQVEQPCAISPFSWNSPLVMLIWGVASDALRDIITGFLDQVRFD